MIKANKRIILFLLISILGISFSFYGFQILYTPNFLVGKEERVLIIPPGSTFKSLQKQLYEGEYVHNLMAFSFLAKVVGYDKNIKSGRYVLRPDMNNISVIRLLRVGRQEPVTITFNNVRLIPELAKKITTKLSISPEEFEVAVIQYALNNSEGFTKDNIIAMFIPNTYEVYYDLSSEALMERMHNEYENFWNTDRKQKAEAIGLTPIEVSILASIVQAETVKPEEAPIIAGLYLNRLKNSIPLQADPTLKFAIGDFSLKRILNVHKEVVSPYNTYLNTGLPPGPINMPEIASLNAVLNNTPSDYLYMCAREDFSGFHNFTHDYNVHIKNAARYQRALSIEQRKARQNQAK